MVTRIVFSFRFIEQKIGLTFYIGFTEDALLPITVVVYNSTSESVNVNVRLKPSLVYIGTEEGSRNAIASASDG